MAYVLWGKDPDNEPHHPRFPHFLLSISTMNNKAFKINAPTQNNTWPSSSSIMKLVQKSAAAKTVYAMCLVVCHKVSEKQCRIKQPAYYALALGSNLMKWNNFSLIPLAFALCTRGLLLPLKCITNIPLPGTMFLVVS